jgi:ribonuclease Z
MTSREVALAFVVKTRAKLGTLLLDKCVDLGVPKGPLLGKLKNNIPVTLEDGRVIDPRDVRSPDDPGKSFIGKK